MPSTDSNPQSPEKEQIPDVGDPDRKRVLNVL
jgi:hypothetical protein